MSEVPEDVRITASRVYWDHVHEHEKNIERIANAILAERERCADIAESLQHDPRTAQHGLSIAEAIRSESIR